MMIGADLDDVTRLYDAAMEGVDAVLLVSPAVPAQEQASRSMRPRDAGVGLIIVKVSEQGLAGHSPMARRRGQSEIEAALAVSGIAHTLLRANAYMQNLLVLAPLIAATDDFASSAADGRIGLVDARDVAAVAIRIAAHPDGHVGKTYWITGPELLSYGDVADTLARVLERQITFNARSEDEDRDAMIAAGVPAPIAEQNAKAFSLIATGDAEWISDDVVAILGTPGSSRFVTDHAPASKGVDAQRPRG